MPRARCGTWTQLRVEILWSVRAKVRIAEHVSFGYGVHRCMGNRLGEMQLRVLWEEILRRFRTVEVVGEPIRVRSNFVKGYSHLPVVLHPH